MSLNKNLITEFKQENESTKKIISIVPTEKFSWKPHTKSMNLIESSNHIVGLVGWVDMVLTTQELDVSKHMKNTLPENTAELVSCLEGNISKSLLSLENTTDDILQQIWTLRMGNHIIAEFPKIAAIRSICFNHLYHHRGQLSVYLRLLDVKIPGMYGPSADEI